MVYQLYEKQTNVSNPSKISGLASDAVLFCMSFLILQALCTSASQFWLSDKTVHAHLVSKS